MATRSKAPQDRKVESSKRKIVRDEQETSDKAQSSATEAQPEEKSAPMMRKGIYLSALVYVEGDMPAPDDFISPATTGLKEALGEAFKSRPGGLTMTLKKVAVQNDVEQDEDSPAQEEKFQF